MHLELTNPQFQKFIADKIRDGGFPTPEAVVEDALARMMDEEAMPLTDQDLKALDRADEEIDRGESVDFDAFAAEMRKKYCGGQQR